MNGGQERQDRWQGWHRVGSTSVRGSNGYDKSASVIFYSQTDVDLPVFGIREGRYGTDPLPIPKYRLCRSASGNKTRVF